MEYATEPIDRVLTAVCALVGLALIAWTVWLIRRKQ